MITFEVAIDIDNDLYRPDDQVRIFYEIRDFKVFSHLSTVVIDGTTFVRKLYELHLFHHTEWKFSENAKIPHERYKTFLRKVQKSWKNFRTNVESLVKVAKSGQLFPKCRSQVILRFDPIGLNFGARSSKISLNWNIFLESCTYEERFSPYPCL